MQNTNFFKKNNILLHNKKIMAYYAKHKFIFRYAKFNSYIILNFMNFNC